jgi:hypothetical protein
VGLFSPRGLAEMQIVEMSGEECRDLLVGARDWWYKKQL